MYLMLLPRHAMVVQSHELAQGAPVTGDLLAAAFDRLRDSASPIRAAS